MNLEKINELVAEHFFEWHWEERVFGEHMESDMPDKILCPPGKKWHPWGWKSKPYSSDIAAAWEVVEKARESFTSGEWKQFCTELCSDWRVLCGDAPKYIVLVALRAKGVEVE